jgi:hypothetical protein
MDDGDGIESGQPQNIYDLHAEWAPATISQDFVFHADTLWELPFGRGKKLGGNWPRALDEILGGWHLNTIWTAQSGIPLNFQFNGNERPMRRAACT